MELGNSIKSINQNTLMHDKISKPLFDLILYSINEPVLHSVMDIEYNIVIRNLINPRIILWN
jgi:hypothetical protein